jgi:hypothetical protein
MGEGRRSGGLSDLKSIWGCKWSVVGHERKTMKRWLQQLHNPNGPVEELITRNFARKVSCIFIETDERFPCFLRQKPSSLFMLLGWGSISVTSLVAYSVTEDGAVCFSKTCVNFCQVTQCHIPEDITLNSHHWFF